MSETDKHLRLIKSVVDNQEKLEGKQVAIGRARSAPLRINADGEIEEYYGEGKNALNLLVKQYEEVWGEKVADRKIKKTVRKEFDEEDYSEVPERVRPEKGQNNGSGGLVGKVKGLLS